MESKPESSPESLRSRTARVKEKPEIEVPEPSGGSPKMKNPRSNNRPPSFNNTSTNLQGSVGFRISKDFPNYQSHDADQIFLTNTRIASSLFLQQILFYNLHFSYCWFVAVVTSYALKEKEDILAIILICFWLVIEPLRLLLGYAGNLQEKVPFLGVFLLVTLFPQVPVNAYFAIAQPDATPFDRALGTVSELLLIMELVGAGLGIRQIIQSQDEKFYLEDYEQQRTTHQGLLGRSKQFDAES